MYVPILLFGSARLVFICQEIFDDAKILGHLLSRMSIQFY